jgi:hypothetical protein
MILIAKDLGENPPLLEELPQTFSKNTSAKICSGGK